MWIPFPFKSVLWMIRTLWLPSFEGRCVCVNARSAGSIFRSKRPAERGPARVGGNRICPGPRQCKALHKPGRSATLKRVSVADLTREGLVDSHVRGAVFRMDSCGARRRPAIRSRGATSARTCGLWSGPRTRFSRSPQVTRVITITGIRRIWRCSPSWVATPTDSLWNGVASSQSPVTCRAPHSITTRG